MSKISDLAKQGVFYTPLGEAPKPEDESGDVSRGFKKAMLQIPQTAGGAVALIGDAVGSDTLRDYGMGVYQNNTDQIEKLTKDSDSLTNVLQGDASAADWAQNALGYVGGQALTALATGGAGGFIGKQLAQRGIREIVARGAESAIAKQVAGKVAAKGAKAGAAAALFGTNLMQEAGSIYPEAAQQAEHDGRTLDGGDLARVGGSALAAAGVDTAMDALMIGRVMKGARKEGEGLARAAMREVPMAAGREAATEGIQTGIERWGAQQDLSTADAIRDYVDSMGIGAVGGGAGGALSVLHAQKVPESGPLSRAANAGIDEQILQLAHDPQPLISFPDGSVGHKQDLEAYLSQFDPEERIRKRREIMGRDPETGKRPEVPEPTSADNKANEEANLKGWGSRHDPVDLDYAKALISAPGAKGHDLMIVPHPKGRGYTVVPSKWLTLDTQARAAALQTGQGAMLPAPDAEAPGGAIRVDSEGGAAPETHGEQARTRAKQRQQAESAAAKAQMELDLGKQTPRGSEMILNPQGEPFKSEMAAKRKLAQGYQGSHIVKAVEGGFVLEPVDPIPTLTDVIHEPAGPANKPADIPTLTEELAPADGIPVLTEEIDPKELDAAAHEAATSPHNELPEPTQAQKEAGNYRKGHLNLHGLDISIENPAGSIRRGTDRDGKPWENTLAHHYGYIRRTEGADGDHVDTFIGPNPASDRAFIVDQVNPDTGSFDEHKVILGANSLDEARAIYEANYAKGWKGGKDITETSVEGFKAWLKDGDTTKPYAPQAAPEESAQAAAGIDPAATVGGARPEPVADAEPAEEARKTALDKAREKHARQDEEVRKAAENIARRKSEKAAPEPRAMTHDGRAVDGKPLIPGDVFKTASGRITTPFPKQKGTRYVSQWMIDNAKAEAEARGDKFNATGFSAVKPLKDGTLTASDNDIINEYLFGQQPAVVPSILKQLVPTAQQKIESGTAPEHVHVGVDDRELGEIVQEFNEAQERAAEGEQVTHVFDPPGKGEVVRLGDKAKVYHKEHGWMTVAEAKKLVDSWKEHAAAQYDDDGKRARNSQRIVLSLFDLTGKWSQPWEDAGYQVFRFDIQDESTYTDSETGEEKKVGDIHNMSVQFFADLFGYFDGNDVYAILAACPCTDFASSGARHFAAKDADGRTVASVKLVHQTLAAIEHFKPAVWSVENPVGRIEKLGGLPPWRLSFDPNHLGDPYTKKTLIWGRFNADLPIAPVEPTEGSKMWSQYGGKSLATKNARSATPEGFAYGFFMANNAEDHPILELAGKYDRLDRALLQQALGAGIPVQEIMHAVDDPYYMDLDDAAAEQAVRDLIEERRATTEEAQPADEQAAQPPQESAPVAEPEDDAADIPLAFQRKVNVTVDVWVPGENRYEPVEMSADEALKGVREDRAALEALLKCMRGN